jgi:hypothetical protein
MRLCHLPVLLQLIEDEPVGGGQAVLVAGVRVLKELLPDQALQPAFPGVGWDGQADQGRTESRSLVLPSDIATRLLASRNNRTIAAAVSELCRIDGRRLAGPVVDHRHWHVVGFVRDNRACRRRRESGSA